MSSCGLLFVFIYSSAAVFMIVDGRTKTDGDAMDMSLLLQKALRVVEMQARTIDSLQAQISKCVNKKPPVLRGPREPKDDGRLLSILTVCLAVYAPVM